MRQPSRGGGLLSTNTSDLLDDILVPETIPSRFKEIRVANYPYVSYSHVYVFIQSSALKSCVRMWNFGIAIRFLY